MTNSPIRSHQEAGNVLRRVVEVMRERMPELTTQLCELTVDQIEAFRDPVVREMLSASIQSNLESFARIIQYGLPQPEHTSPPVAAGYARLLAQRGIDPASLLRSYRLGQESALLWTLEQTLDLAPNPTVALEASRHLVRKSFQYVDAVSVHVIEEYDNERARWLSTTNTVRNATIDRLIAGAIRDVSGTEESLGYRLRQHHIGVVLWLDHEGTPEDVRALEHALGRLGRQSGGVGKEIFVLRDQSTAWGWIPLGRHSTAQLTTDDDLTRALAGVGGRAAIGSSAPGMEGFRTSHAEACKAHAVALAGHGGDERITAWAEPDVRTASLLLTDLDATRNLVASELGELAADTETATVLRRTLRVLLAEQGSYAATAARLDVHKNTVRYRTDKAIALRGRPLNQDRLDLELALIACERLGPTINRPHG